MYRRGRCAGAGISARGQSAGSDPHNRMKIPAMARPIWSGRMCGAGQLLSATARTAAGHTSLSHEPAQTMAWTCAQASPGAGCNKERPCPTGRSDGSPAHNPPTTGAERVGWKALECVLWSDGSYHSHRARYHHWAEQEGMTTALLDPWSQMTVGQRRVKGDAAFGRDRRIQKRLVQPNRALGQNERDVALLQWLPQAQWDLPIWRLPDALNWLSDLALPATSLP